MGAFAVRYDPEEDIHFSDGYIIKAGTPIMLPLGKVMTDPELWDHPEVFNPDRFDQKEAKTPLLFSPFGFAGGRICPGRSFSYAEGT
jgi:cytochrome P450 family 20 subfamily A